MVLSFSTNPYNNYYAANSKEFISLDKAAKQDFRPGTRYDLLPGNAGLFALDLEKYTKHYGYSFLLNVLLTRAVDATNANAFVYSDQVHMLETWNQVTDLNIAINANKIWGTRNWTRGTPVGGTFQIAEMNAAHGEIGTANAVSFIGRKKFLNAGNQPFFPIRSWKCSLRNHRLRLNFTRASINGLTLYPMKGSMMVALS